MEQVITQLAVKILFDDYSGFYDMRRTIILPKKQKLYSILYMYMTWIRIGLEYSHKKETFTKLYCLNVKRLFPMFL